MSYLNVYSWVVAGSNSYKKWINFYLSCFQPVMYFSSNEQICDYKIVCLQQPSLMGFSSMCSHSKTSHWYYKHTHILPVETSQSMKSLAVYRHNVISSLSLCKMSEKQKRMQNHWESIGLRGCYSGFKKEPSVTFFNYTFFTFHNSYAWVGNMGPG